MRNLLPVAALAALLAVASPAFAHSYLQTSSPAGGSTTETPPTEVTITFTEALEPSFSGIVVRNAAGKTVSSGPAHAVGNGGTELAVPLAALKPGSYTVLWHATSTDTHKTHGAFKFDVVTPD